MKQIFIIIILFSLTACSQQDKTAFDPPHDLKDGWSISKPEVAGFDRQMLEESIGNASTENSKLDAIVIARDGKLIVDQYFNGYAPDKLHKIWSITKSVTGTALGIAVDKKLLAAEDSIYKHLGPYRPYLDSAARSITIEHLITMTSGIEWVSLGGPGTSGFELPYSKDWIKFILNQPHTNTPGEVYNYSDANTLLLALIMKNASKQEVHQFSKQYLFEPFGITHYEWDTQSEFWTKTAGNELPGAKIPAEIEYKKPFADLTNTASGLRMRPRDLCKFGQLYLNNGKWNQQQVVNKEWIEASTKPHFGNKDYGYHWRLMSSQDKACYYATGFGLQRIFVFPTLELVVVLTQHHYETMPEGDKLTKKLLDDLLLAIKE